MSNRLANAASPYLRQHAGNPVDWHEWNETALREAREQGKPILLSIGYSACHWCHVMAHESFEDEATARVMNALFVNIKVDREERPDLDRVYQLAHQLLTGRSGGWPLTVFLTPDDHVPFYAGTYFPRRARHGLPPFVHVLERVRHFWDTRHDEVRAQNRALTDFLATLDRPGGNDVVLDPMPLRRAREHFVTHFDAAQGGRHGAPKFPHAAELELLLDLAVDPAAPAPELAILVERNLEAMAGRGLHDHLGGGFFRYCVDARWEIPHFEKMLYDNAQLLPLYARAARRFGRPDFEDACEGIVAWLRREMAVADGGYAASLDADSEGEEGRHYLWQRDAVRDLLTPDEFAVAARRFGFDRAPNFEGTAWHPVLDKSIAEIVAALGQDESTIRALLASARAKLAAARAERPLPGRDDKRLTAWNALLASGLARAARYLGRPDWAHLAVDVLDFIHERLWRDDRLYACFASGVARFPAYLDDHAFLLDALIERLQCAWNVRDAAWASAVADRLIEDFEDRARGGFFFTAHDAEPLPHRPKPWMDDSLPGGNGVAARALLRLGHLTGKVRYLDAAQRVLHAGWHALTEFAPACSALLRALHDELAPRWLLRLHCAPEREADWRGALREDPIETLDVFVHTPDATPWPVTPDPAGNDRDIAYLCRGSACEAPLTTPEALAEALRKVDPD